ncbi:MAG: hypothetical protein EXR70_01570 [Deltaproteobacteria bacterium]|nr:hypothetical protein [Deltaproteobacteria bacterium]
MTKRKTRNTIKALLAWSVILSWQSAIAAETPRQSQRPATDEFDSLIKAAAPIVLCIDDKPSSGGQPSGDAYANAAANGFRAVLTLRARQDGVDTLRERFMVEQNQLRYFNLPFLDHLPTHEQIDEFLRLVRDKRNQPMLVNCAFAERVAPYMMIFHVVEQGWSETKAADEASHAGQRRAELQKFLRAYLKPRGTK